MAGILHFGRGFGIEETTNPSGDPYKAVVGIDGDIASITWSSVEEMQTLAEQHGVNKELWPVYPDCEMEGEIPLEDAVRRSAELWVVLERVDPSVVEGSYWLSFVWRLLRDGHSFFIKP